MTYGVRARVSARGKELVVAAALLWATLIVAATGSVHRAGASDQVLPVLVVAVLGSVAIVAAGVRAIHR